MPFAPAPLHPLKTFSQHPAPLSTPAPVTLLPNYQSPASFRNSSPFNPHVPATPVTPVFVERFLGCWLACAGVLLCCSGVRKALTPSVLVNSSWGFGWSSAGVSAVCLGALKALTQAVLVKRPVLASVRCTSDFDQRVEVQCWPGTGSAKRALGFCWAVAGGVRQARQSVLVKSFSGSCSAPPPPFCVLGAGSALNGLGASHA